MPVAATGLAEVLARDAHPLKVLGAGEHPLEQLAIAGLELSAVLQGPARVLDPIRECVANRLQLAQVERSGLGRDGSHAGRELEAREGLGDQGGELPL
jgi:hypothetical protein